MSVAEWWSVFLAGEPGYRIIYRQTSIGPRLSLQGHPRPARSQKPQQSLLPRSLAPGLVGSEWVPGSSTCAAEVWGGLAPPGRLPTDGTLSMCRQEESCSCADGGVFIIGGVCALKLFQPKSRGVQVPPFGLLCRWLMTQRTPGLLLLHLAVL